MPYVEECPEILFIYEYNKSLLVSGKPPSGKNTDRKIRLHPF